MRKIAFFDFDGTITRADTMLELIKFHFGNLRFYRGLFAIGFSLAALKAGLLSRQKAKEKLLKHFFKGMDAGEFKKICQSFSEKRLPSLIRPEALNRIDVLRRANAEVVVVTASASDWVKYWCKANDLPYIATELDIRDGKLTGKLRGLNCNGPEKVSRIRKEYDLDLYSEIHCFGDSSGDKEMLGLATHAFYKEF